MQWLNDFVLSRRKQQLTRDESLAARPVRNPAVEWSEVEGDTGKEVLLVVPARRTRAMPVLRLALGVSDKPRRIQLDEVGTFVWLLCDGNNSVDDVCCRLRERYRLSHREALISLTTYLRTLGRRGLIAFAVDKELCGGEHGGQERRAKTPKT